VYMSGICWWLGAGTSEGVGPWMYRSTGKGTLRFATHISHFTRYTLPQSFSLCLPLQQSSSHTTLDRQVKTNCRNSLIIVPNLPARTSNLFVWYDTLLWVALRRVCLLFAVPLGTSLKPPRCIHTPGANIIAKSDLNDETSIT